ncbi:MAG: PD-(D/E)XK nuclease family protein [Gemmatimonadetes bacterium]|nr:PD-(D/E)XK nuclease family protein [Gemmatimonadota bacterium]
MDQSKAAEGGCHLGYLGWRQPILWAAADALLASAPEGHVADLSNHLVVLPVARAGRRLVEILLARTEADGRPLRPPGITTVGGMPEHLYLPARPLPDPVAARSAWRQAVGSIRPDELAVLAPAPSELDVDGLRSSIAATLESLHDRVGAAGLGFHEVAERCRQGLLFSDEERWMVLARAQQEYRALLAAGGWSDREGSRRHALEEGRVLTTNRLWVIGAPDLPPVARAFLEAVRAPAPVEILIGAPADLAAYFDHLGCLIPEAWEEEGCVLPDSAIRVVTAPGEQADVLVEHLRHVARGRSAEEISVGVPDRDVVPYVVERLEEEGIRARHAEGRRIERTALYRLLAGVAVYLEGGLEGGGFEGFADLIRHPEVERRLDPRPGDGGSVRSAVSRVLPSVADRYQALHLPSRLGRVGERLPMGGERVSEALGRSLGEFRDGFLELLRPLEGSRPLSQWAERIRGFLVSVYGSGTYHRARARDRELVEVMAKVGGILEGLEGLADLEGGRASALDEVVSASGALRTVIEGLSGEFVPPAADEEAIELLGWLELALDDAPVLVVTGANEPHLPQSVTFDPFLPHALEQALGLLDNRGRWARDVLYVRTILATRPDTLFVAGRQDPEGNPLHISRLLLADEPLTAARRIRMFFEGRGELRAGAVPGGEGTPLVLPPEPVISAPAPPKRIRVTAFREILADPYRYALERILGLESEDDRARELDPLRFGTLAHEVLRRYGRGDTVELVGESEIRHALDGILELEARERFGSRPLPAVTIQVEQLRRRLHAFARWQAEWMSAGWRIQGVELSFVGEGASLAVDGEPIGLAGKVDRVDQNVETGVFCILDYKTGERVLTPDEVHRRGRDAAKVWVDLQLPLYRYLAPSLLRDGGEPVVPTPALESLRVGYLSLPRDPALAGVAWAEWTPDELGQALERAREVVRFLRQNRFEHNPATSRIEPTHPLAPVVGGGVLRLEEDERKSHA